MRAKIDINVLLKKILDINLERYVLLLLSDFLLSLPRCGTFDIWTKLNAHSRNYLCMRHQSNHTNGFRNPSRCNHLNYAPFHLVCLTSSSERLVAHHYAPKSNYNKIKITVTREIVHQLSINSYPKIIKVITIDTYVDSWPISVSPIHQRSFPMNS